MAEFIPAAVETTIQRLKADIRSRTGVLGKRRSEIIEGQLDSIIYDAICTVRSAGGVIVDAFYNTTETLVGTAIGKESYFPIHDKAIARLSAISVYDKGADKEVYVMDTPKYKARIADDKNLPEFSTVRIAHITNMIMPGATDLNNKLYLITYYGVSLTPPLTAEVTYPRNPLRILDDAAGTKKPDAPDSLMPIIKDFAILMAFKKVKVEAPADEAKRASDYLRNIAASVGIDVEA